MKQSIDITLEEKNAMIGGKYNETAYFNPVLDINNVWQISFQCVDMITNESFLYLKDRGSHEYIPPEIDEEMILI